MNRTALLALILTTGAASAEVARVQGGEHPEFTRIVIEARGTGDWRFGRTEDGYELALGPEVTGYDLSQAFEKIPRDRVSGLWRDPDSGRLRLSLSCACHAIAFEFRPGIVVVDIKTGAPPESTAFEAPIDPPAKTADSTAVAGDSVPPDMSPPEVAPEATPQTTQDTAPAPDPYAETKAAVPDPALPAYDWLAIRAGQAAVPGPGGGPAIAVEPDSPLAEAATDPGLDPLRDALLRQISQGVAEGVLEIAEPGNLPGAGTAKRVEEDGVRISLGELPGIKAATVRDPDVALAASGAACPPEKTLAVQDWGLSGPPAEQLGPGRSGLLAEFDVPVEAAVLRAARLYVSLGFGAEARQFLAFLEPDDDPGRAILLALTHLIDLEPAEPNPFAGLEACDTTAALWAAVAMAAATTVSDADFGMLNKAAVARSFSALPVHLRRHLGPALVDLFLAQGDDSTARLLRDATLRAPGEAGHEVTLMDADYHLATGKEAEAGTLADTVRKENGPGREDAAITLVEAAFSGDLSIPADLPEALAAFRQDARDSTREAALTRALILGTAMAGDFVTAFATLPEAQETAADLWTLAVEGADDGIFLEQAVAAAASSPPSVKDEVALEVATRLEALGFAREALAWLGPVDAAAPEATRLLAARARLRLRDARAAISVLSGLASPEAETLRAAAILQLGDPAGAAEALDRAGDTEARDRADVWTTDWPRIAETGPDPWKAAAALVVPALADPDAEPPAGPIAQGTALVEESARARATIEALLDATAAAEAEAGP